jgi:hypothetical protein
MKITYCVSGGRGSADMEKREISQRVTVMPQRKAGLDAKTEIER